MIFLEKAIFDTFNVKTNRKCKVPKWKSTSGQFWNYLTRWGHPQNNMKNDRILTKKQFSWESWAIINEMSPSLSGLRRKVISTYNQKKSIFLKNRPYENSIKIRPDF